MAAGPVWLFGLSKELDKGLPTALNASDQVAHGNVEASSIR
jgi:hypothetical protein